MDFQHVKPKRFRERIDKNSFVIEIAPGHRWIIDWRMGGRIRDLINTFCLDWSRTETFWLSGVVQIGRVGSM